MPTVKFILQQPYKTAPKKDKAKHAQGGESVVNAPKRAKKGIGGLNPKETRLYCYLIIKRKQIIKIKTEYKIFPKEWDFSKQGKKGAGSIEFNNDLAILKNDIHEKYKAIVKEFPDMPFSQISRALKDYGKTKEIPFLKNDDKTVFDYLKEYREHLTINNSPGTVQKFVSIENSLKDFINTKAGKKYDPLTFSMIDHSFIDAYTNFLHNQPARGRMKRRPEGFRDGVLLATESKYIADIKTFLKWAEDCNYNRYSVYKDFTPISKASKKRKTQKNDIITLTLPELKQFYSYEFSGNKDLSAEKLYNYNRVRDLFCFGCFTLQRWSDIDRFEKSQLKGNVWTFEAFKTKKETEIDLIGYFAPALDILEKYDYQLPKISLAKFNLYLKEAAKTAGITAEVKKMRYVGAKEIPIVRPKCEFLTSHDARRTGISILLNNLNFPISNLMEITQHSDLKTLQVYINPDRGARKEAVSRTKRIDETLTIVKSEAV